MNRGVHRGCRIRKKGVLSFLTIEGRGVIRWRKRVPVELHCCGRGWAKGNRVGRLSGEGETAGIHLQPGLGLSGGDFSHLSLYIEGGVDLQEERCRKDCRFCGDLVTVTKFRAKRKPLISTMGRGGEEEGGGRLSITNAFKFPSARRRGKRQVLRKKGSSGERPNTGPSICGGKGHFIGGERNSTSKPAALQKKRGISRQRLQKEEGIGGVLSQ